MSLPTHKHEVQSMFGSIASSCIERKPFNVDSEAQKQQFKTFWDALPSQLKSLLGESQQALKHILEKTSINTLALNSSASSCIRFWSSIWGGTGPRGGSQLWFHNRKIDRHWMRSFAALFLRYAMLRYDWSLGLATMAVDKRLRVHLDR